MPKASDWVARGVNRLELVGETGLVSTAGFTADTPTLPGNAGIALLDVPVGALALAADSDLQFGTARYWDPILNRQVQVRISPGCPVVNLPVYPPPSGSLPPGINVLPESASQFFDTVVKDFFFAGGFVPTFKVIAYLSPGDIPPLAVQGRSHRHINGYIQAIVPGTTDALVTRFPFWGRNRLSLQLAQDAANFATALTVKINGVRFGVTAGSVGVVMRTQITTVALATSGSTGFMSSVDKFYDAIEILADTAAGAGVGSAFSYSWETADALD